MTGPTGDGMVLSTAHRSTAARLARLHLRTGALSLARAELETLAGRDALDDDALLDLAEVRWRTGDLAGAGEAARAYLEMGNEAQVALVVAAEAAVALGRPGEARRLAQRAIAHSPEPIDDVFSGMPRSAIWPTEPGEHGEQGPLFAPPHLGVSPSVAAVAAPATSPIGETAAPVAPIIAPAPEPTYVPIAPSGGLWDDLAGSGPSPASLPSPRDALDAGRAALAAGDLDAAAVQLAIAIRLEPGLAAAVLGIVASAPGAAMDVLRGDALRLAGHEERARRSWAAAVGALEAPRRDRPDDREASPRIDAADVAPPATDPADGVDPADGLDPADGVEPADHIDASPAPPPSVKENS